jgi:hypothetical protein
MCYLHSKYRILKHLLFSWGQARIRLENIPSISRITDSEEKYAKLAVAEVVCSERVRKNLADYPLDKWKRDALLRKKVGCMAL